MRKLLQNKAVVGCLAVIAALAVAGNFVELPKQGTVTVAARSASPTPSRSIDQSSTVPPPLQAAAALSGWRDMFPADGLRRDPFALAGVRAAVKAGTNAPFPSFTLQAVSLADRSALAVINQTVVAEGEWLSGWQIEKIEATQVRLTGRLGSMVIELDRSGRRLNESIGNPAPADLRTGSPLRAGRPNN